MKPRLFSIIAVLVTFVGGVVTGSWLSERKLRVDNGDFVEWVNGDDIRAALSGLRDFGVNPSAGYFGTPPSRNLHVDIEDHQIASITAYLEKQLPAEDSNITLMTPSSSIVHHAGQWIDIRPAMQALATRFA